MLPGSSHRHLSIASHGLSCPCPAVLISRTRVRRCRNVVSLTLLGMLSSIQIEAKNLPLLVRRSNAMAVKPQTPFGPQRTVGSDPSGSPLISGAPSQAESLSGQPGWRVPLNETPPSADISTETKGPPALPSVSFIQSTPL